VDGTSGALELAQAALAAPRTRPAAVQYLRTRTLPASPEALRAYHVSVGEERTPIAEAFKRLRTRLLQLLRESGRNALGVTSPRAGEGKRTGALNLAAHSALERRGTGLLVGCHVRR